MPAIRPVLIVGTGDHSELAAALRTRGFGPMLASNAEQAARLLRHFRVDVLVCVRPSPDSIRKLGDRTPAVLVGGSEAAAWEAGAAGFVGSNVPVVAVAEAVLQVARGERRVRIA